jgi:DNA-binding YbaB/EbfC family protein
MFKEIGQFASLVKSLPKIREEMDRLQGRLGQLTAEGDAGGGMVKIRVNGHMEVVACNLSDDAIKANDKELLEDLIRAAVNQAIQRIRGLVAEETSKMAAGLGIPSGMNLPGVS